MFPETNMLWVSACEPQTVSWHFAFHVPIIQWVEVG
jgi:hypothetical protein